MAEYYSIPSKAEAEQFSEAYLAAQQEYYESLDKDTNVPCKSDYISREAAIKTHCSCCAWQGNVEPPCDTCKEPDNFRSIPAADVRPVVLCKDCSSLYRGEFGDLCCSNHSGLARVTEDSFCSYGRRRNNA